MITTVLLLCAAPAAAFATPATAPAPLPDDEAPPALLVLRRELGSLWLAEALAQQPRFRPLCDGHGYPLVGNLSNKGPNTRPSTFCAEVRRTLPTRKVRET